MLLSLKQVKQTKTKLTKENILRTMLLSLKKVRTMPLNLNQLMQTNKTKNNETVADQNKEKH